MKSKWNLELPDCILSITGTAQTFEKGYEEALDKVKNYLKKIIRESKNTWIITGGSHTGVSFRIII